MLAEQRSVGGRAGVDPRMWAPYRNYCTGQDF